VHEKPCLDAVPAGLAEMVRRCLAKDPESRPTPAKLIEEMGGPSTPDGTWRDRPLLNDERARPEENGPAQRSPTTTVDPSQRSANKYGSSAWSQSGCFQL
jgi:hypothetical protein